MKNSKGFIQIPLLITIIVGVLFLGGGGYFGVKQYQNYQKEQTEKEKVSQETQQQKDLEVEKLKQEVEALKNKKPEVIKQTIVKELPAPKTENNLPSIIKEWNPRVVYIECEWAYSSGEVYAQASGSATLINYRDTGVVAVTNKHVLMDEGKYTPKNCTVVLPDVKSYVVKINRSVYVGDLEDWGFLRLPSDVVLDNVAKQNIKLCSSVNIGDSLLILGYPSIGSQTGITVTEGIISGYDGNYYITSAKIEHGNSGGAAILVKDSCYLGVPSASVVGDVESLGRILKASFLFGQ